MIITSNSRPWRSIGSFMYIGSAGPGPGGRTDDGDGRRTDGRTTEGGRADGRRADGRAAGMILHDSTTIFIDFHKKTKKNILFFCRFASGGRASTYSSNEKGVQKM